MKIGDVVQLVGTTVKMTVLAVNGSDVASSETDFFGDRLPARCVKTCWFDTNDILHSDVFPIEVLEEDSQ